MKPFLDPAHLVPGADFASPAREAGPERSVFKSELRPGDRVLVTTRNSVYAIRPLGGDRYAVSGGWFAMNGLSPAVLTIHGCTFGGHAIQPALVAAPGLCLEFGNRVVTTPIQNVLLLRREDCLN